MSTKIIVLAVCGFAAVYILARVFFNCFHTPRKDTRRNPLPANRTRYMQTDLRPFGSWGQALQIHALNLSMIVGLLSLTTTSMDLYYAALGYVFVGVLILRMAGIPSKTRMAPFGTPVRMWLRCYHAWLWPLYLTGLMQPA
jgi:hypothetical protein